LLERLGDHSQGMALEFSVNWNKNQNGMKEDPEDRWERRVRFQQRHPDALARRLEAGPEWRVVRDDA
jgi:hypothetical protein